MVDIKITSWTCGGAAWKKSPPPDDLDPVGHWRVGQRLRASAAVSDRLNNVACKCGYPQRRGSVRAGATAEVHQPPTLAEVVGHRPQGKRPGFRPCAH